jgi:aminopeptidase N
VNRKLALLLAAATAALAALPFAANAQTSAAPPAGFTMTTGTPRTSEQTSVKFDHADLSFRLFPEEKRLDGVAELTFTATAPFEWMQLELDDAFAISAIAMDAEEIHPDDGWRNDNGRLSIDLAGVEAGQTFRLRIAYSGKPHEAKNAPWDGGFVWGTTPNGKPWIATAVQGEGCDLFWPCIDHPQGEPDRVDLHITVPAGLGAPSNGRFVGKSDNADGTTTWNWSARQPDTYAIALNVGPYVEMADDYRSRFGNVVPMRFWRLETAPADRAAALFAEFPKMLDFYEATIGPFPFGDEKMGVVETPHLGMEHQTINAYGNAYKLDGKGYDWLLQHELAHEWFGNQMTNADWDDMWLHEGFGTYMQPLYARWLNGDRYMEAELVDMRKTLANRFPLVSGRSQDSGTVYNGETGPGLDLYYKGALVAHTLRLLIGDEAFFRSLRRLVYDTADPRPGNFRPVYRTTRDYIRIVSEEAGRDMGWFFRTYVYQAELPRLELSREGDRAVLSWSRTAGDFPLPVEVEVDGRLTDLDMVSGRAAFDAPAGSHILIDPHNKVLRHLDFIEAFKARNASN